MKECKVRSKYFENLDEMTKEYFSILSDEFPDFLYKYIDTKEMQRQDGISVGCSSFYSKLFNNKLWFSNLDHSVGVALIVWHFTKDKKQTLAGLFHDIATPAFKHCIDFMNGDYEKQESTEDLTRKFIEESEEIMNLLDRDGIKIEEVSDYHIYPIADNDTPMLSADRLEYTLSNGFGVREELWDLEEVRKIYQNIEIQKNENGIDELGFKDKALAEKFVKGMSVLAIVYMTNELRFSMQFLADIMKKMSDEKLISKSDLYRLSEKELIEKIENCNLYNISENFNIWRNATRIKESDTLVEDKYCVGVKAKVRYIIPLVKVQDKYIRINEVSESAAEDIKKVVNYTVRNYAYLDFNF